MPDWSYTQYSLAALPFSIVFPPLLLAPVVGAAADAYNAAYRVPTSATIPGATPLTPDQQAAQAAQIEAALIRYNKDPYAGRYVPPSAFAWMAGGTLAVIAAAYIVGARSQRRGAPQRRRWR